MGNITRGQIHTLTTLLILKSGIVNNSLTPDESAMCWIMNPLMGRKIAKAYSSIVVSKFYNIGTNIPETTWVADEFAGSPVMYTESVPEDAIGFGSIDNVSSLIESRPEDVRVLFNEASRAARAYRNNAYNVQFVVGVDA